MIDEKTIGVIIPMLNEERSIQKVFDDIPAFVDWIVTVDNGSRDRSAEVARSKGAIVLSESRRGYGWACMKGIEFLRGRQCDIIAFMDGDYSDHPEELPLLIDPIIQHHYDLAVGSRVTGMREDGALPFHSLFGNRLAGFLINVFWKARFTDLGPFRVITREAIEKMNLREMKYGWTVDMQIVAAKMKLKCTEIPVRYRKRIGKSKVTGTVKGTVLASITILSTIFRHVMKLEN